ncbi:MAG: hypothetical protein DRN96_04720 [Thermoproteota archaeon]|nr:MAG: hypothetical protein DRN96_04720 [Candidatus Korarchaeota archaeon]RLG53860.1 MAG: hypothetical protein DRN99_06075 [Candidatus Korarchaeota archaeon]
MRKRKLKGPGVVYSIRIEEEVAEALKEMAREGMDIPEAVRDCLRKLVRRYKLMKAMREMDESRAKTAGEQSEGRG